VQACGSLAGLTAVPVASANPVELDKLGVHAGDEVCLRTGDVSLVAEIEPDPGIPAGVVLIDFNLPVGEDGRRVGEMIDADAPVTNVRLENL
jgi:hypothetical protein